ncbi:MAG: hypothetical protein H6502_00150 [Candidatus Woesearchaeota archaeon]|nr:MAG: hypothetical protein H6502_00150 [Candidatus Woesearchaeota archaeon]
MNPFKKNVVKSFRAAKQDITRLQQEIVRISTENKELKNAIASIQKEVFALSTQKQPVPPVAPSDPHFVASNTGEKFHQSNCPFASNIKKGNRTYFPNAKAARDAGYKACNCVN